MDALHRLAELPYLWLRLTLVGLFLVLVFRHRSSRRPTYYGNPNSRIYHFPDCKYGQHIWSPKIFRSPDAAVRKGYRSCIICNPPAPGDARPGAALNSQGRAQHPETRLEFPSDRVSN